MDRLTEKISNGYTLKIPEDKSISDLEIMFNVYDRLGYYEDAEEQGLLLRLPCNVGDTVWCIFEGEVYEGKATRFNYWKCEYDREYLNIDVRYDIVDPFHNDGRLMHRCDPKRYSERVFLTKEEAKQALANMKAGAE